MGTIENPRHALLVPYPPPSMPVSDPLARSRRASVEQIGRLAPQVDQIDERVKAVLHDLGGRIRMARLLAGKTQETVAFLADIDSKRYQHIEAGKANVTMRTLVRLCLAIGIDWIELLQSHPPSSLLGRLMMSHPPCEAPAPLAEKTAP